MPFFGLKKKLTEKLKKYNNAMLSCHPYENKQNHSQNKGTSIPYLLHMCINQFLGKRNSMLNGILFSQV